MSISAIIDEIGRTIGELAYVISPILLEGGVADKIGIPVPILLYTEALALGNGLISGGIEGSFNMPDLDNLWCHWNMPPNKTGATTVNTLLDFTPVTYSMGNQEIACNHLIGNPLTVSLQMMCPARGPGAIVTKLATIQSLQAILNKHSMMGGHFTVVTPGFIYTNMMLKKFSDISANSVTLPASLFQLDFQEILTPQSARKKKKKSRQKTEIVPQSSLMHPVPAKLP